MRIFMDLVNIFCKNLQIEDWCSQVLTAEELEEKKQLDFQIFKNKKHSECLVISENNFRCLLNLLLESSAIQDEKTKNQCNKFLLKFILPFVVYGEIRSEKSCFTQEDIIKNYLLDDGHFEVKSSVVSAIIANYTECSDDLLSFISEKVKIEQIVTIIKESETEKEIDEGRLVTILDFWTNCLHNEHFRSKVASRDVGIQLYEVVTQANSTHPHKLSLNVKRLVIKLIIKLTLGFEDNENALAKRIIKDLEPLKDKKDIDFVNNILTPLLKAEQKVSISFDFYDKKMQTFHTFTNAIEECRDSPKVDNFLSYPLYSNIIPHLERVVGRDYNSQKLIISDWKPIFLSKKEGTASFKDMLMTIENKTSLFFIFEGTSKKIGDS